MGADGRAAHRRVLCALPPAGRHGSHPFDSGGGGPAGDRRSDDDDFERRHSGSWQGASASGRNLRARVGPLRARAACAHADGRGAQDDGDAGRSAGHPHQGPHRGGRGRGYHGFRSGAGYRSGDLRESGAVFGRDRLCAGERDFGGQGWGIGGGGGAGAGGAAVGLWGRTPVLRPPSTSAGAGPGGLAQTWRSAPHEFYFSCKVPAANRGFQFPPVFRISLNAMASPGLADCMMLRTSAAVATRWRLISTSTSPFCRPISSAKEPGSTLAIATPPAFRPICSRSESVRFWTLTPRRACAAPPSTSWPSPGSLPDPFSATISARSPIFTCTLMVFPSRRTLRSTVPPGCAAEIVSTSWSPLLMVWPLIPTMISDTCTPALAAGPPGVTCDTNTPPDAPYTFSNEAFSSRAN